MDILEIWTTSGDAIITGLVALLVIFLTNKSNADLQEKNLKSQWEKKYFDSLVNDVVSYIDSILILVDLIDIQTGKDNYNWTEESGKILNEIQHNRIKVRARVLSIGDDYFTEVFDIFLDDFMEILDAVQKKDLNKIKAHILSTVKQSGIVFNAIGYKYGKMDFSKKIRRI